MPIIHAHAVSTPDMSNAERLEYESWVRSYETGAFDDEAPGQYDAEPLEPSDEDRRWWSDTLAHTELPDSELLSLTAADWCEVERAGHVAFERARDRGESVAEAGRWRDEVESECIRFWLGERGKN